MRFLVAALLLVCGAATALATVALHSYGWGLLLGAAATLVSLVAVGAGWSRRLAFGAGWVGVIAWVTPTRAEGDFAISSDLAGYGLLGADAAGPRLLGGHASAPPAWKRGLVGSRS